MSETLTPVFRLEYFITAAANGTPCDLEPIFNEEKYLHAIAGASVNLPMPIGRTQEYLAKLAGMDVEIPDKPIYRTEYYLAHMIDSTVECPAPIFREEMFYYEWASNEYVTIVGNPVSFTAKAAPLRQLKVAFSPVQDLHGYDAPWPAGGGKNIYPNSSISGSADGITVTHNVYDESYTVSGLSSAYRGFLASSGFTLKAGTYTLSRTASSGTVSVSNLRMELRSMDGLTTYASTINAGTFTFAEDTEVKARIVVGAGSVDFGTGITYWFQLESGSSPSTWAPYTNICPITGWDSLNVEQRGKNLLNINSPAVTFNRYTDFSNGVISNQIADTRTAPWSFIINAYDSNGTSILQTATAFSGTGRISIPLTIPANAVSLLCRYSGSKLDCGFRTPIDITGNCVFSADVLSVDMGTIGGLQIGNFMIELGTTASPYQPYNPSSRSISISLGSTVYSGTLDVTNGTLTVDRKKVTYNGSEVWSRALGQASNQGYYVAAHDMKKRNEYENTIQSDTLKTYNRNSDGNYTNAEYGVTGYYDSQKRFPDQNWIYAKATSIIIDTDAFKQWLSDHPLTVVYELATPQTIQLTPQEVESLLGENNMFSDANGDLTVEYRSN